MNKKTFACCTGILLGCAALAVLGSQPGSHLFTASGSTGEGVWNHYAASSGDEVKVGTKEYWIQCGTDEVRFTAPSTGTVVDKSGAPDQSGYSLHDDRFVEAAKEYVFAYDTNLVGASIWNVTDASDYTWGLNGQVSDKSIAYKSYAGKTFKNVMPKVNFNYYESVTMDLETTIWNEGYKFGFTEDVQTTGMEPVISVKTGGKIILYRLNDTTVRMIINHTAAGMNNVTHDFVGKDYVLGNESVYFYTYATGDAYFKFTNWAPQAHNYTKTESTTSIAAIKYECTCGDVKYEVPTFDFTTNKYGASIAHYHTGSAEDVTWVMNSLTHGANQIQYKSYNVEDGVNGTPFVFGMPRIDFRTFAKVEIEMASGAWWESIKMGFTKADLTEKDIHTTYGGEKTGKLTIAWDEDVLKASLAFENATLTEEVTNADIIDGTCGFEFWSTSGYDRILTFKNFSFTLSK